MAARNKHCEKLTSRKIRTHGLWISGPMKSKGLRFESCTWSIFRNAYFLQPLFWRFYDVAVLAALKGVL